MHKHISDGRSATSVVQSGTALVTANPRHCKRMSAIGRGDDYRLRISTGASASAGSNPKTRA